MDITPNRLRETYAALDKSELIELLAANQLTDEARAVLEDELRTRGITAPEIASEVATEAARRETNEREREVLLSSLASRRYRLLAHIIDVHLTYAVVLVFLLISYQYAPTPIADAVTLPAVFSWVAYMFLKDGFEGQSLGKRLLGMQVIHAATLQPCSFPRSLLRNLLFFLGVFDAMFIFGKERRRLGDLAANTYVRKLKAEPA